jgi:hypothetical protein
MPKKKKERGILSTLLFISKNGQLTKLTVNVVCLSDVQVDLVGTF